MSFQVRSILWRASRRADLSMLNQRDAIQGTWTYLSFSDSTLAVGMIDQALGA
jgi:hypothetical protein